MKKLAGFSLIELMIGVSIVGILVALSLPAYHRSIQKANRADAKVGLTTVAQRMQRCFSVYNTFQTDEGKCDIKDALAADGVKTDNGFYLITGTTPDASHFELTAVTVQDGEQAKQKDDTLCAKFELDSTGKKKAFNKDGDETSSDCW